MAISGGSFDESINEFVKSMAKEGNVHKYSALKEIMLKLIDHRDNLIQYSDEYTESTMIKLCEGIDKNIETIVALFIEDE